MLWLAFFNLKLDLAHADCKPCLGPGQHVQIQIGSWQVKPRVRPRKYEAVIGMHDQVLLNTVLVLAHEYVKGYDTVIMRSKVAS